MTTVQAITSKINKISKGEPFSTRAFQKLGSRAAVDKTLSRLVEQGLIKRVTQGVYVRPKENRFIGSVTPSINKVVKVIAESNGETIQVHGAEAANRFQLSTQTQVQPVYYTSGSSRSFLVGSLKVTMIHASHRKLQLAGKRSGLALSALWYLGKEGVTVHAVKKVCSQLKAEELLEFMSADKPAWMETVLKNASLERIH